MNSFLLLIFCITLFNVMGITSIVPAFPLLSEHLDITSEQVGLLLSFYTLPAMLLLPFFGWLADRYGRKNVIIPSLIFVWNSWWELLFYFLILSAFGITFPSGYRGRLIAGAQ